MTAEIISVGTELLLGNILNTNAQYLSRELADLGFDEIVLTHCAYPTEGAVECLRPLGDKTGALEKLLRQLQGAVADWETEISLRACADADEPDSASGQTEALLAIADAVISE